jgi:hypoxanthine phosphoribosyltransferase
MKKVKISDKEFKLFIPSAAVKRAVDQVAMEINNHYFDQEILFISVLNGAFAFSSDLIRKIKTPCQITFVKLASYNGNESSGVVKELIGLNEKVEGRHVILIEDIVDTGLTIESVVKQLKALKPASVKVATLLFKPQAYQKNLKIDYIGIEIANEFVVGCGLDYNGYGRNLEDIYSLVNNN